MVGVEAALLTCAMLLHCGALFRPRLSIGTAAHGSRERYCPPRCGRGQPGRPPNAHVADNENRPTTVK